MSQLVRGRVLHLLSQRPARTGSGVTLDALVREADRAGWEQAVVVGTPASDPRPRVGGLDPSAIHPLVFGRDGLPFALPGMSDVMPYATSRFADLDAEQLAAYRRAWARHLTDVVRSFRPTVIHGHHLWLLGALVKTAVPDVPLVLQSHATGLRQMALCPHLADEAIAGCRRADRILVLTHRMRREVVQVLGCDEEKLDVVGAGYRDDLFHASGRRPHDGTRLLYAGKLSRAKGLPWLLDACEGLRAEGRDLRLDVVGSGAGPEAESIERRLAALDGWVTAHGHVDQWALAAHLRASDVFVLPSFYEGLPLVVVEAMACGCRAVVSDLPAVREDLAPSLGRDLELVPLPRLAGSDRPREEDLPRFVDDLKRALGRALDAPAAGERPGLDAFTWRSVFSRVERAWEGAMEAPGSRDVASGEALG